MAAPSIYHPFQVTERDAKDRCLIVTERHMLDNHGRTRSSDYLFVMRCWTPAELHSSLRGFGTVAYFGAYDAAVAAGSTDRIIAVAQLSNAAIRSTMRVEYDAPSHE